MRIETFLLFFAFFLLCLIAFIIYVGLRIKRAMDRFDSILKTLDDHIPKMFEELLGSLKSLRILIEKTGPLPDDIKRLVAAITRISSLIEVLTPDPNSIRAIKDWLSTIFYLILSIIFPERKGAHEKKE